MPLTNRNDIRKFCDDQFSIVRIRLYTFGDTHSQIHTLRLAEEAIALLRCILKLTAVLVFMYPLVT